MTLRTGAYDPAVFVASWSQKRPPQQMELRRAMEIVSPVIMYQFVRESDPQCWFCRSPYAEMTKRYEIIAEAAPDKLNCELRDRSVSALLSGWRSMRPANRFSAVEFAHFFQQAIASNVQLELVSLMCPAYSVGRDAIATQLVEGTVADFVEATAVGLWQWRERISHWRVYVWDERGLRDPLLASTVHPRLLARPDVGAELNKSWHVQKQVLDRLAARLEIPVTIVPFTELGDSLEDATRILGAAEKENQFLTRSVERLLRQGARDYEIMGEDIYDHRTRFRNDAFIFAAAVLKEGLLRPTRNGRSSSRRLAYSEKGTTRRVMLLLESRSHHVGALRLYDLPVGGESRCVMPVWALPSRLRSYYWVNPAQKGTIEAASLRRQGRVA